MVNPGIDQMISQLRAVAAQAALSPQNGAAQATTSAGAPDFSAMLHAALNEVNSASKEADQMTERFELGDTNANLQDVVMSLQKASVSFQTMVQVRNKLVSAYQEVMNMQV
jgi:flagellar hook-basal body complex protein FliE